MDATRRSRRLHLQGAFDGRSLAATLDRARERHGLASENCVGTMTDGASACSGKEGESQIVLRMQRERAASSHSVLVHSAQKETCAIHAKALEEAHGLEAPSTLQLD
eukprot:6206738-Pleurochrysis_carterae.AAC.2